MDLALPLVVYGSIAVFLIAVIARFVRISRMPRQIRWEIYPLPHEGERAKHGGSRMEEVDHWEKPQKKDRINELKFMIPEMIFLKGLWDHNRKLWYRSFPFHFGLYLLIGVVGLLAVDVLASLVGWDLRPYLAPLVIVVFLVGAGLALIGTLGLLLARATDEDMKPYTNFSHFFNLFAFLVVLGLLGTVFVQANFTIDVFRSWMQTIVTANTGALEGGTLANWAFALTAILIAYIPLTHMSHFFVKWFTWHQIRWDDEPNVRGGNIEKMIEKALQAPMTWAAPHVGADGKKSWADIATEEVNEK